MLNIGFFYKYLILKTLMQQFKVIALLLIALFSFSQKKDSIIIKGVITQIDSLGPVPFASVFIHKTTIGVTSNEKGEFKLQIPKIMFDDTLIVSSIGYSKFKGKISDFRNINKIKIFLSDSIFLLDEVVAIPYDYFETLEWESRNKKVKAKYLTYATEYLENISSFIKVLKSEIGKPKEKNGVYFWKRANIPVIGKNTRVSLRYFSCPYCVDKTDYSVTILIKDNKGNLPLNDTIKEEKLENFFQGILDKTYEMGVDYTLLEKVNNIYYQKGYQEPYTGKCFGYFKNSQIGLKGAYIDGKKDGKWEYWYSNGQNKMLVYYNKGKKVGKWLYWYDNGIKRIDNNYVNDRLNDKNYWWYKNGSKKKVALYNNGKFIGKVEWNKNGKVIDKIGKDIR